jgi:hypothetical protein
MLVFCFVIDGFENWGTVLRGWELYSTFFFLVGLGVLIACYGGV